MQIITYRNILGATGVFGYDRFYTAYLDNFKDEQSVSNWVNTGYNQHGETYIKGLMNPRQITLSFWIKDNDNSGLMDGTYASRRELNKLFNPTLKGTLEYNNGVVDRYIEVYVDQPLKEVERKGSLIKAEVIFNAPFPFWTDLNENHKRLSFEVGGGLTFDFKFDHDITFGMDKSTNTVDNSGDIETPATFSITCENNADNIKISNETGAYIGIAHALSAGDEVVITTEYGNKNVTINGQNANKYLMEGSSWLQIPLNGSTFSISGGGNPVVDISWKNYYIGV